MGSRILLDQDMLISAVRYALGRRTYIVAATVDEVLRCWPDLSANTRAVILRDIAYERTAPAGPTNWQISPEWDRITAVTDA